MGGGIVQLGTPSNQRYATSAVLCTPGGDGSPQIGTWKPTDKNDAQQERLFVLRAGRRRRALQVAMFTWRADFLLGTEERSNVSCETKPSVQWRITH